MLDFTPFDLNDLVKFNGHLYMDDAIGGKYVIQKISDVSTYQVNFKG